MELTHRYVFPDRFISGAVGEPPRRIFFVQARQGSRMTNVVCEQAQLKVLAAHLEQVLAALEPVDQRVPGQAASLPYDPEPLDVPLDEDFRAGTMAITWQPRTNTLLVELYASGRYREPVEPGFRGYGDDVLQVEITVDQARNFVARTDHLLGSLAPSCPFCNQPVGPHGHLCPRANGYRKPLLARGE
ncbi:MAG: DUF3090 family protein [Brooklawnia sp.]|jgi:uncharacterized repeat protein (TIGR03847 family)